MRVAVGVANSRSAEAVMAACPKRQVLEQNLAAASRGAQAAEQLMNSEAGPVAVCHGMTATAAARPRHSASCQP